MKRRHARRILVPVSTRSLHDILFIRLRSVLFFFSPTAPSSKDAVHEHKTITPSRESMGACRTLRRVCRAAEVCGCGSHQSAA